MTLSLYMIWSVFLISQKCDNNNNNNFHVGSQGVWTVLPLAKHRTIKKTLKKQRYPSILLNLSVILDQHLLQRRRALTSMWRAWAAAFAAITLHLQPFSPRRRRHWTEETMKMHLETKLETTHRFFLQTLIVLTTPHKPVKVESNSAADSNVQVPSYTGRRVVR